MKNIVFLLLLTLFPIASSFAQDQIVLTRVRPTIIKHDGSYFVDREQIVFNKEKGTNTLYYRKKPGKKLKKFKQAVDLSFFTALDYYILDNVMTHSVSRESSEHPCNCNFMNKGSIKVTLKSGEAMAGVTKSYEFGSPLSCNDQQYFTYMKQLDKEYMKLYKLVFGK